MSVTIYEHADFTGNVGYFPDPASTPNLGNYAMGNSGYSWNDQVSSLYTSTYLKVFQDANYDSSYGAYAILPPGFHDFYSLNDYGIGSDEISSFYATIGF
jgi:Peptidase inhibitor family I36